MIYIRHNEPGELDVKLFDMGGRILRSYSFMDTSDTIILPVNISSKGIYVLVVSGNNGTVHKKIML